MMNVNYIVFRFEKTRSIKELTCGLKQIWLCMTKPKFRTELVSQGAGPRFCYLDQQLYHHIGWKLETKSF